MTAQQAAVHLRTCTHREAKKEFLGANEYSSRCRERDVVARIEILEVSKSSLLGNALPTALALS